MVALSPRIAALPAADARSRLQRISNARALERRQERVRALRISGEAGRTAGALAAGQLRLGDIKVGGKVRITAILGIPGKLACAIGTGSHAGSVAAGMSSFQFDLAMYEWSAERQRPASVAASGAIKALLKSGSS